MRRLRDQVAASAAWTAVRCRYGMRWPSRQPHVSPVTVLIAGLTLALLAVSGVAVAGASAVEAAEQRAASDAARLAEQVAWKQSYAGAMLACMNGGSFYFPDTNVGFICSATEVRL